MRILFFTRVFGGVTTTFIRNEIDFLTKENDFLYLCQQMDGNPADYPYVRQIPFTENRLIKKIRWKLWQWDRLCSFVNPAYGRKVKALLSEFRPDVIHCHFAYEAIALLDNIAIDQYKVVLHFHGYDASQMIRKKSYIRKLRSILKHPNVYAVSVNRFFIQQLSALLNIPPSRFLLLHCGVDTTLFSPGGNSTEKKERLFVQVSSLALKKGHEFTLKAFALFTQRNPGLNSRLILTGDGSRKEILSRLALELGIADRVEFTGNVDPLTAVSLLRKADVFLHHSITPPNGDMEGIPTAIMEAMAVELPIVSTIHSGIPELVEEGVNGYLVPEKEVEQYALRMEDALKIGRLPANRQKIEAYFNKINHNQDLYRFYSTLTGA
ncbi:MAG: glycosyltransferase [Candidatus Pseudobacter hemicellulosilyticus]|uniref:Glycosyltransferase n=1 Tax=Candidatus Pseudobacter hemicellulosilyticus TaxID=3121375 RepID=A0AAJ6BHR5_9BACT|nr:MAG: glycosyltransferase [Pseudobacter sp.]